jgi:HrpA-like RNA helicase
MHDESSYCSALIDILCIMTRKWIVLMLHSSLTVEEQEKAFDSPPEGIRKCIVSSNM